MKIEKDGVVYEMYNFYAGGEKLDAVQINIRSQHYDGHLILPCLYLNGLRELVNEYEKLKRENIHESDGNS